MHLTFSVFSGAYCITTFLDYLDLSRVLEPWKLQIQNSITFQGLWEGTLKRAGFHMISGKPEARKDTQTLLTVGNIVTFLVLFTKKLIEAFTLTV